MLEATALGHSSERGQREVVDEQDASARSLDLDPDVCRSAGRGSDEFCELRRGRGSQGDLGLRVSTAPPLSRKVALRTAEPAPEDEVGARTL